jgi:hypothetical protein
MVVASWSSSFSFQDALACTTRNQRERLLMMMPNEKKHSSILVVAGSTSIKKEEKCICRTPALGFVAGKE